MGEPYKEILEHAIRRWDAEEENARRQASRINFVVTLTGAVLAFLGFSLFRFPALLDVGTYQEHAWLATTVRILAGLSITSFIISLFYLILTKSSRENPTPPSGFPGGGIESFLDSSFHLRIDEKMLDEIELPEIGSPEYIRLHLATRTFGAADDLAARNLQEKRTVDIGQQWFLVGFVLMMGTAGAYIFFG